MVDRGWPTPPRRPDSFLSDDEINARCKAIVDALPFGKCAKNPVWNFTKNDPDTGRVSLNDKLTVVASGKEIVKVMEPITEETIDSHVVALGIYAQAIVQGGPKPKLVDKKILKAIDAMITDTFNYGIGAQKVTVSKMDMSDPVEQAKVNLLSGFDPTADSPAGEAARAAYRTFARILRLKGIEPELAVSAELVADTYDR